jgi:hypothetical protein
MTGEMDRRAMLRLVREGRERLEGLLAQFDEAQMATSHPPDGWSVKDVMAHITFWESHVLERFKEAARGENPHLLGTISDEEVNRINQEALMAGRARSLDEVKEDFQRVHRELIGELKAIPESQEDAWWALWPKPDIPWRLIESDTYYHYEEHMASLRVWASGNE